MRQEKDGKKFLRCALLKERAFDHLALTKEPGREAVCWRMLESLCELVIGQEVQNLLFCHLQEKFHTVVFKGVPNISDTL